ncbi:MAG: hypothetical protein K2K75_02100 [Muribaculaceae bacterium]|nr:hypothetical protein [Muribaculaceae bacterium]
MIIAVVGFMGLMYAIGCGNSSAVEDRLSLAEQLMEESPDSALCILNDITESELRGKRRKARYALLKSMALDKNYIDTTTFDVLQPAIDYYLMAGNPDERIRTYYYEGRIHRNAGNDDLAMQSYLSGLDNLNQVSDSLTLARMLVAQATLYYKLYQINDFVDNNRKAAEIYDKLGKQPQRLKSNLRVLTGEIILNNKHRADSILNVCKVIAKDLPSMKRETLLPFLKWAVNFGTDEEVLDMIEEVQKADMEEDMNMTLARAYSKIGDSDNGLRYLGEAKIAPSNILDSLTYWSVKTEILENMGDDKASLDAFRNYSRMLEKYHTRLFSNELLFSEKKHELEMENMAKIRKRDSLIMWISIGSVLLVCIIAVVYYRYRLNRAGRLIAEGKAEKLKLESENLHFQVAQLEVEREYLKNLLDNQETLSEETRQLIRERIEMLNGLFAQAITNEEKYGRDFQKYTEKIKKDKKNKENFQQSIVKVLDTTHPKFMAYLREHELTERELNYCCLYAIGLRGKEIGNYLDLVRHYNISSDVRRKLGLDVNGENLGPFIKKMMAEE